MTQLTDLQRATAALNAARTAHDTLVQDPQATDAEVVAAFCAFREAEVIYDDAMAQEEREAEREHLAGQAARTRAATLPLPEVIEVEHIEALPAPDAGEWEPEPTPTPPAGSIPSPNYGTTANGRTGLSALEVHCLDDKLVDVLKWAEQSDGTFNQPILRECSALAIQAGDYLEAAAIAILLSRCA